MSLLNLATHTPGGMPLQTPDSIVTAHQLITYLRDWKPTYRPGTVRTYSNISIALLEMITARAMNGIFAALMQNTIFEG